MNCSCCGRRKKLFESFESISSEIDVCVECSTLLYKLRDYKMENKEEEILEYIKKIGKRMENKSTKQFDKWFTEFSK